MEIYLQYVGSLEFLKNAGNWYRIYICSTEKVDDEELSNGGNELMMYSGNGSYRYQNIASLWNLYSAFT